MINLITGIKNGKIVDEEIFNEGLKYFEGKKVIISCKEYDEQRSIDQNKALWRWNEMLAKETGDTPNDMHYLMCGEIFGWKKIKIYDLALTKFANQHQDLQNYGFEEKIILKEIEVPRKTTKDLKTKEFSDYITQYFIKVQELFNYTLPPFGWDS